MTDDEIRDALRDIDENDEVDVNDWEAEFLDSIVYQYEGPLTDKQREKAFEIIEEYEK